MPSNINLKNNLLINDNGSHITDIHSNNDKSFAVIARCGHCGHGYFIPIIFTTKCKDISTAIEIIKSRPRVKRDKKDAILDAFEISKLESYFIKTINDHDTYLTNKDCLDSIDYLDRRILDTRSVDFFNNNQDANNKFFYKDFKTAEEYSEDCVLEKYFAPIFQGTKLVYPRKPKKDQLLHDFFRHNCIRYGIKRNNAYFLSMYFQMYGENNDLGIKFYDNKFYYEYNGNVEFCEIPQEILSHILKCLEQNSHNAADSEIDYHTTDYKRESAMDKFNRRLQKTKQINSPKNSEPQPGE